MTAAQPQLKVLSLGWGVQSWTLAAMVALGELEPIDLAIHSDTTWERASTYQFAKEFTPWLQSHGITVTTVSNSKAARKIVDDYGGVFIPAYTINNGKRGQLRRQCTGDWKIDPMRRHIATELKRRELTKTPGIVEQWLGITIDEWQRAKDSNVKYIRHRFPLLEMSMSRSDCLAWLSRNNLPSSSKSACTFCPYHNRLTWEQMKRDNGADWLQACDIDTRIRNKRPPSPLFVHSYAKPLTEVVTIPEDYGATQLSFLDSDDNDAQCDSGYCFL
uniref:Putative phosphoadenosine phosphosulfate reductase family protein n=1 Tax=viral metagenome TaxID=1070528 RepID=A0A6M3IPG5_9ZZZZ